jgi:hypothetical protein
MSTRTPWTAAWCALLLAAPAVAQGDDERTLELQRTQRALQQSRRDVERLLDVRLRHDLGLPADTGERAFAAGPAPTTETMERMQQEWRDEEAATASLLDRYQRLRTDAEALRAEAAARARPDGETVAVTVPRAGTAVPAGPVRTPPSPSPAPPAAGEAARRPEPVDPAAVAATLDPLRAQIHGSTDHRRVALALFRAGQALMDRAAAARAQEHVVVAKELDERAAERLQRALAELAPLLQQQEPPLDALFCQGRCLELLFRHAERHEGLSLKASTRDYQRREQEVRDPWLRITARDVRRIGERGETEVLGRWGMAAQAALEHFRWMNLHAAYDARATIDALSWPGAQPK